MQLFHVLQSLQTKIIGLYIAKKIEILKETKREYMVERRKLENYLLLRRESKGL